MTSILPDESIEEEDILSNNPPHHFFIHMIFPVDESLARKTSFKIPPELDIFCPKKSTFVPTNDPVTMTFPSVSVEVEAPESPEVPHHFFTHMRFPVEESFARKTSAPPELERFCPKISVPVPTK